MTAQSRKRFPSRTNFKIWRAAKTASASGFAQTLKEMADGNWEWEIGFVQFFSSQASSVFLAKRFFPESRFKNSILIFVSGRFSIRWRHCWNVLATPFQMESQEFSFSADSSRQNASVAFLQNGKIAASKSNSCGVISAKPSKNKFSIFNFEFLVLRRELVAKSKRQLASCNLFSTSQPE